MGRRITAKIHKSIDLFYGEIKTIFETKIKPFSKSGAYIPTSQTHTGHRVYVIVMKRENDTNSE